MLPLGIWVSWAQMWYTVGGSIEFGHKHLLSHSYGARRGVWCLEEELADD
jgi:hypothetical protein